MPPVLRDVLGLLATFLSALALRAAIPDVPWLAPFAVERSAWMGVVLVPAFAATAAVLRADPRPAPAPPEWLVAGPVALALSLAGFELLRIEPVTRSLAIGFALVATPVLGVLASPRGVTDPRPLGRAFLKRVVDIALSGVLALLFAPLIGVLAWRIRGEDGGPALFVQTRIGWDGVPFQMVKLRTMRVGAEAEHDALASRNQIRGPAFRVPDDPRVTRTGRWIRALGLDELPQLINVLRGEMSLVGPRPPLPSEVERYTDAQRIRLSVPPGITGLWQLTGRELLDFDDWVALDRRYIETWSLLGDAILLVRTLGWLIGRIRTISGNAVDLHP